MKETRFKQTDIGLVPEDWDVVKFNKIFSFLGNNTYSREQLSPKGKVMNVHYGDILIKYGTIINVPNATLPYIKEKHYGTPKTPLNDGDLIFADTAEDEAVGKACEIRNVGGEHIEAGLHTMPVRPIQKFAPKYLGYYANSQHYHNQLLPLIQGTKVCSISKAAFITTSILFPSLPEQQRIAEVLGRVDELLVRIDKLIAKKQAVKQGAMQQLLTGRTRLDGFTAPWTYKNLREMCAIIRNGINYTPARHGGLPVTRIETISNGVVDYNKVGYMQDAPRSDYRLQYGDILFSHINSLGNMGKNAFFDKDNFEIYHGMNLLLLRTNKSIDAKYVYYMLNTHSSWQLFQDIAKPAVNQASISIYDLSHITYCVPPSIAEQRAITRILTHMDKEIEALLAERRKVENIKKGMMQQLLTGKIRLSV